MHSKQSQNYNAKVLCIESETVDFTAGEYYTVTDGVILDNSGTERPIGGFVTDITMLNKYLEATFKEEDMKTLKTDLICNQREITVGELQELNEAIGLEVEINNGQITGGHIADQEE